MNKGDKPILPRKQAEESILKNMRDILDRVETEKKETKDNERVDRSHVFSVINHFTALKRSVKL